MKEILLQLIDGRIPITLDVGTVKSVNGNTCHVESIHSSKDFFSCRINAIEKKQDNYLRVVPSIGSSVIIGVFKDSEKAVILSVSEVDEMEYSQNGTRVLVSGQGVEIERNKTSFKDVLNDVLIELKNTVIEVAKVQSVLGIPPDGTTKITSSIESKIKVSINQIFK